MSPYLQVGLGVLIVLVSAVAVRVFFATHDQERRRKFLDLRDDEMFEMWKRETIRTYDPELRRPRPDRG